MDFTTARPQLPRNFPDVGDAGISGQEHDNGPLSEQGFRLGGSELLPSTIAGWSGCWLGAAGGAPETAFSWMFHVVADPQTAVRETTTKKTSPAGKSQPHRN
jgi:hypothetical protein